MDLKDKRLLILGGTSASLGVVKEAKEMGIYVIVTDDQETGVAKVIADEAVRISTTDLEALAKFIEDHKIDGVFCGPTEFNLQNAMALCEKTSLPFYCTREQWNKCSNKLSFKELCNRYEVPCVPEFHLTEDLLPQDLDKIVYPVIIKPVDGASSKGLTVCRNQRELIDAVPKALEYSSSKKIIVEKYLIGDYGIVCRYITRNGQNHLVTVNDNYTVDTSEGKLMITAAAVFPSKRLKEFQKDIHPHVDQMMRSIGFENGTFFMQARVDGQDRDKIYFHEMGLRLSGGVLFPIYKRMCGFSDMKMMIRHALGDGMGTDEEVSKISPDFNGKYVGSLCIPLKVGTIASIEGLEEIKNDTSVFDVLQYYYPGDKMVPEFIGTLMQHFCRIKFTVDTYEDVAKKMDYFQSVLKIRNAEGEDMIYKYFDTERLK